MSRGREIDLRQHKQLLKNSAEVARIWVTDHGPSTVVIDPGVLDEPFAFGILMVDTIRHAARAYAHAQGITEAQALILIWGGVDAERARPTATPQTITPGESIN
jgi:hypothetical protein